MSNIITNNAYLQAPLQRVIEIYQQQIVPRLTTKNKTIGITAAVAMTLIYLIRDKILKPPRNLRHIPYQGYYDFIKSIYKKETYWDRAHRWTLPFIDSESSNGLYVVMRKADKIYHGQLNPHASSTETRPFWI